MSDDPAAGGQTAEPAAERHAYVPAQDDPPLGQEIRGCRKPLWSEGGWRSCGLPADHPVHQPATDPAAEADR